MSTLDFALEKLSNAKSYGRYVVALCPFHEDHKPSFFVYEDSYRCLSCGAHGKTSALAKQLSNIPGNYINEQAKISKASPNPFTRWISQWGLHRTVEYGQRNMGEAASHYLKIRGIDSEHQHRLRLGKLDGFIIFPIYNHWGELQGAIARVGENNTSTAKYYLPKGQNPKLLYVPSWKKIKESREVFVTFGIIDAISLYIMGYASASTITGQTASAETFVDIRKHIVLVPDKQEEISAWKIVGKLHDWRGSVLSLPFTNDTKDVNDLYIRDKEWLNGYLGKFLRDCCGSDTTESTSRKFYKLESIDASI